MAHKLTTLAQMLSGLLKPTTLIAELTETTEEALEEQAEKIDVLSNSVSALQTALGTELDELGNLVFGGDS